jgi:hypothetical protein
VPVQAANLRSEVQDVGGDLDAFGQRGVLGVVYAQRAPDLAGIADPLLEKPAGIIEVVVTSGAGRKQGHTSGALMQFVAARLSHRYHSCSNLAARRVICPRPHFRLVTRSWAGRASC